jgi:hypothetical protein
MSGFFEELRQRKVYHVAAVHIVAAVADEHVRAVPFV